MTERLDSASAVRDPANKNAARWLLAAIRGYQQILSPLLGNCCRHEPSCSRYAALCLRHLPMSKALWLTTKRLLRCNPLFAGGVDLPPLPASAPVSDREPDWLRIERMHALAATGATPTGGAREPCPPPGARVVVPEHAAKHTVNAVLSEHQTK